MVVLRMMDRYDCVIRKKMPSFKEAYTALRKHYISEFEFGVDDFDEDKMFDFDYIEKEFKEKGYVEFCDGDYIATLDFYIENIL